MLAAVAFVVAHAGQGQTSSVPAVPSVRVRVLLLNGSTGKPLTNLGLLLDPVCLHTVTCIPSFKEALVPGHPGEVELSFNGEVTAIEAARASAKATYCQGETVHGELHAHPQFSVETILRTGIVAPNTCAGWFTPKIQPEPGRLVFFLRPTPLV